MSFAKEILEGRKVLPEDIELFEIEIGECLTDSNHWMDNPYTVLGFSYATEEYAEISKELQEKVNKHGMNVDSLFLDVLDENLDLYYKFVAHLINSIPVYRQRFEDNLKETV